ncbi:hypothetical protein [Ruegeria denitrificans]|uniref:hypothetical protein n=1 Tax=Ruegeria denitrificans TaxID=1715692 RepID=UPI00103DBFA3|nr:hypothetical protein [Ruegeria denitrificans]
MLARRSAESAEAHSGKPKEDRINVSGGNAEKTFQETTKQQSSTPSPEQANFEKPGSKQAKPKRGAEDQGAGDAVSVNDALVRKDTSHEQLTKAELSLILSSEEVDHRLSKKLLQQLEDQQSRRRRVRWGLVAVGCTIGAVASSSVFLTLTGWDALGLTERSASGETASTETEQFAQSGTFQPDVSGGAEGEAVISADLFDASSWPASPDTGGANTEDPSNIASLTSSLSEGTDTAAAIEPSARDPAPNILSYVPALEPPLLPVGGAGYLPLKEANPSFLPYEVVPEFFAASITLADRAGADLPPTVVSVEPIIPPQRAPNVFVQLAALQFPTPPASVTASGSRPGHSQDFQSDRPLGAVLSQGALSVVASDPVVQLENAALSLPTPRPPVVNLAPNPPDLTELAALPTEETPALPKNDVKPLEPAIVEGGTEYRLFAPNNIPNDAVNTVVTGLTTTGHELGATARVPYKVTRTNVRYYHRQDAAKAAALAKDAGALLRDFTGASSKTPNGVIELYLAGEGFGRASVPRTAKKSRRNTAPSNSVDQLRSQVLKKLRTTTN